jgi:hypothetical protein
MDIVTFETAKALKEAGFPSPSLRKGQVWYHDTNKEYQVVDVGIGEASAYHYRTVGGVVGEHGFAFRIRKFFAPSAVDILNWLGADWALSVEDGSPRWRCFTPHGAQEYFHENPAEACAAAWLAYNKT